MQVRVFIKPDHVALMLSAVDWLSDRAVPSMFVGDRVCLHANFMYRYVAVGKSKGDTYLCYFEELLSSREQAF